MIKSLPTTIYRDIEYISILGKNTEDNSEKHRKIIHRSYIEVVENIIIPLAACSAAILKNSSSTDVKHSIFSAINISLEKSLVRKSIHDDQKEILIANYEILWGSINLVLDMQKDTLAFRSIRHFAKDCIEPDIFRENIYSFGNILSNILPYNTIAISYFFDLQEKYPTAISRIMHWEDSVSRIEKFYNTDLDIWYKLRALQRAPYCVFDAPKV